MAHGYAREFDEARDRDADRRERSDRGWRGGDERDRDYQEREGDREFMFGDDRSGDRWDRGAWENNGDWPQRDRGVGDRGMSDPGQSGSRVSSHADDHYRSWRDRHMEALDRDYQDYCREREEQFHRDFDDWRRNRGQNRSGQGGGQSRLIEEAEYSLEQTRAEAPGAGNTPSPMSEATLGANNSENSGVGRGRK